MKKMSRKWQVIDTNTLHSTSGGLSHLIASHLISSYQRNDWYFSSSKASSSLEIHSMGFWNCSDSSDITPAARPRKSTGERWWVIVRSTGSEAQHASYHIPGAPLSACALFPPPLHHWTERHLDHPSSLFPTSSWSHPQHSHGNETQQNTSHQPTNMCVLPKTSHKHIQRDTEENDNTDTP